MSTSTSVCNDECMQSRTQTSKTADNEQVICGEGQRCWLPRRAFARRKRFLLCGFVASVRAGHEEDAAIEAGNAAPSRTRSYQHAVNEERVSASVHADRHVFWSHPCTHARPSDLPRLPQDWSAVTTICKQRSQAHGHGWPWRGCIPMEALVFLQRRMCLQGRSHRQPRPPCMQRHWHHGLQLARLELHRKFAPRCRLKDLPRIRTGAQDGARPVSTCGTPTCDGVSALQCASVPNAAQPRDSGGCERCPCPPGWRRRPALARLRKLAAFRIDHRGRGRPRGRIAWYGLVHATSSRAHRDRQG